jgi:anti-anti-sigma factor
MATRSKTKQGIQRLKLEGEMTIYNAAEMKASLTDTLHKCQEMEIDVSKVSEMDTAGVQILLLTKREAGNHNKSLRVVNHSDAVLELFNLYHVAEYFGDPIVLKHKSD